MHQQILPHFLQATMSITPIIPRRGINDDGKGKKHALHKLIAAAETEYVWLQDDDITLPPIQLSTIEHTLSTTQADLLILPLRMAGGNTLLERLQVAEYAALQQVTVETALRGKPILCSGANMIVRRERWLESWNDLHPDIPSGDDMFLLESFKRRGLTIAVLDDPQYTAVVNAVPTWRAFFRQRMRWAGKAPHFTDRDIRQCGIVVLFANILQVLCPPVLLVKFPLEYRLIKKRDASVSLFDALLLELLYPFYMAVCLIGGLFRRKW